ncbi:hypothetical protein [Halorubellus salinus]|uniref:hypothetical protein n=1 Tax=Halorubellus salinus TaxID=755309 RepID=UPI001D084ABD|nr:hypothetical protein [Halorubellus salinus]
MDDVSKTLSAGSVVTDVELTGGIRANYESPDSPVDRITATADLGPDGNGPGTPYGSHETTNEHTDLDPHSGSFKSIFNVSLVNDWSFTKEDFNPEPGSEIKYSFILIVFVDVYDSSGGVLANEAWESYGDMTISRPEGGGEPSVEFTGEFEFAFTIEEE